MDLALYDADGRVVARDTGRDDRPGVVRPRHGGEYTLAAAIPDCRAGARRRASDHLQPESIIMPNDLPYQLRGGLPAWTGVLLLLAGNPVLAADSPTAGALASAEQCRQLAAAWWGNRPGIDFEKIDPAIAVPTCEQAVKENPGNADLKAYLCRALQKAERYPEALTPCQRAAEGGSLAGMTSLGRVYETGNGVVKNEAQAVAWYRKAAEQGYAPAQTRLGWAYQTGQAIKQDDVQAIAWYRKAAEQGVALAQNYLGWMYETGRGVMKDEAQAVAWYRKAAEQGFTEAQGNLGVMYENGRGIAKDEAQAVVWYRKGADQGDIDAQFRLGRMYEDGRGVKKDVVQAVAWYRKIAEQGYAPAQTRLGWMYREGFGGIIIQDDIQAVAWYRKAAEQGYADAQNSLGWMYENGRGVEKDDVQAMAWYRKAAEQGDTDLQVKIGWMYENGRGVKKDDVQAMAWYRKAAEQGNIDGYCNLGFIYSRLNQFVKAQESLEQALALARQHEDHTKEGWILNTLGFVYTMSDQPNKALESYQQALVIHRQIGDQKGAGSNLGDIGATYRRLNQSTKALEFYQEALAVYRVLGDRVGESKSLIALGFIYFELEQFTRTQECWEQALAIATDINQGEKSEILNRLGFVYLLLGQPAKGQKYLEQALALARERTDRNGESFTLTQLGLGCIFLGQHVKAIEYLEQARTLAHESSDWFKESLALAGLGAVYSSLGQSTKGQDYSEQARVLIRNHLADIDPKGIEEFRIFENLLEISFKVSKETEADDVTGSSAETVSSSLEQALSEAREHRFSYAENYALLLLGATSSKQNQIAKSQEYWEQALAQANDRGDRLMQVFSLIGLAATSVQQNQLVKAKAYSKQALLMALEMDTPELIALIWGEFMMVAALDRRLDTAIFAGKQAVNILQTIRQKLQPLDRALQKTFLENKKFIYQSLAELLIFQGRLPEAEQVLRMLKEEEYFDFLRHDPNSAENLDATSPATPLEQKFYDERLHPVSATVTALGREYGELEKKSDLNLAEKERVEQLKIELESARQAFQAVLTELETYFDQAGVQQGKNFAKLQLDYSDRLQTKLQKLDPGTVVLYTLVTDKTLHLLLLTPYASVARSTPIAREDLHRLISNLREALQYPNPERDPRPEAEKLYRLLIAPIADDLQQAQTKTLIVSLDGMLRYIPLAALYDEKQKKYLNEQYALAVFTPVTQEQLTNTLPQTPWRIAAFGASSTLPAVPAELKGIVRQPDDGNGVMDGQIYLDHDFTEQNFNEALRAHYPLVHLATHFVFGSNDRDSYLLLGDSQHLSLARLNQGPPPFGDVDLVTLSACQTALDTTANGMEIDGLGTLVQKRGAHGVIATLWSVADASTSLFMQRFYQLRVEGKLSKAEALRQVQIEFIHQSPALQPGLNALKARGLEVRGFTPDHSTTTSASSVSYPGYTHPYFWGPFILMGNWR